MILTVPQRIVVKQMVGVDLPMNVTDQRIACQKKIAQKMNVVLSTGIVEQTLNFVMIYLPVILTESVRVMNAAQNLVIVDLVQNIVGSQQQRQQHQLLQKNQ